MDHLGSRSATDLRALAERIRVHGESWKEIAGHMPLLGLGGLVVGAPVGLAPRVIRAGRSKGIEILQTSATVRSVGRAWIVAPWLNTFVLVIMGYGHLRSELGVGAVVGILAGSHVEHRLSEHTAGTPLHVPFNRRTRGLYARNRLGRSSSYGRIGLSDEA